MSEDKARKTVKPSEKRKRDARNKGQVAVSKDLTSIVTMAMGASVGFAWLAWSGDQFGNMTRTALQAAGDSSGKGLGSLAINTYLSAVLPVIIGAAIGFIVTAGMQLGWPPALKRPRFDLGKIFTLESIGSILSPKASAGRAVKATAKVGLVLTAVALAINNEFSNFLVPLEPDAVSSQLVGALWRLLVYATLVLFVLAFTDYLIQRRKHAKDLMMTPEEAKQEHKQQEGDPHVRAARKRRMRELATRRRAIDVRTADVVVVNPTHYAVALRYDSEQDGAPRVVAKGRGPIAKHIREVARKAGLPILSRPPLTRLIYKTVPEGREIPGALYQVVAEVLAYVYRCKEETA